MSNKDKVVIGDRKNLEAKKIDEEHALNTKKRIVFSPENVWDSHVMRVFTMEEDGQTFEHEHKWPHWIYVISGKGSVIIEGEKHNLNKDSYLFVPGGIEHFFKNESKDNFEWICIVPPEGDTFKK